MSNLISINTTSADAQSTPAPQVVALVESLDAYSAMIDAQGNLSQARSCFDLSALPVPCQVMVVYDEQNEYEPIIVAAIPSKPSPTSHLKPVADKQPLDKHLNLSAYESVTIECGMSSITMKKNGEIKIKGKTVTSHASAQQKIKGASVNIN